MRGFADAEDVFYGTMGLVDNIEQMSTGTNETTKEGIKIFELKGRLQSRVSLTSGTLKTKG